MTPEQEKQYLDRAVSVLLREERTKHKETGDVVEAIPYQTQVGNYPAKQSFQVQGNFDEGYEHEPHHDIVGMTANKISRLVSEQVDNGVRFVLTTIKAEVSKVFKEVEEREDRVEVYDILTILDKYIDV